MGIEVFFNRPARPFPLDRLLQDIRSATVSIHAASAWFTLRPLAEAICAQQVRRLVLLNAADLARNGGAGAAIANSFRDEHTATEKRLSARWETMTEEMQQEVLKDGYVSDPAVLELAVLGAGDYSEGIMHHKAIVLDSAILWVGSYNLTWQAGKNYENLLRIEDEAAAQAFAAEFEAIASWDESALWDEGAWYYGLPDGAFRCGECRRIYNASEMGEKEDTHPPTCKACLAKLHAQWRGRLVRP